MENNFVDFRQVKERITITSVLHHYGIRLRGVNRLSLRGKCPLPTHSSRTSMESFSVQTEKNIWACQSDSCAATRQGKKGGNIIDLVAIMEGLSIRDAAVKLHELFLSSGAPATETKKTAATETLVSDKSGGVADGEINKPLTFTLNGIDFNHPYLHARGLKEETIKTFGAGFFPGRGSMSGRVVIPIHNERGELIAYAGRSIDESEPKYKLPAGFKKSAVLFNLHRLRELAATSDNSVIVVEGFFDCMKVDESGSRNVVALMGSSLSDEQAELLCGFQRVILFLDGDEPGKAAAQVIASRLMYRRFIRVISTPHGKQPDQLSSEEIQKLLAH